MDKEGIELVQVVGGDRVTGTLMSGWWGLVGKEEAEQGTNIYTFLLASRPPPAEYQNCDGDP